MPNVAQDRRRAFALFLFVAVLLQLPLVLNRGYFNHDELQWLWLSDTDTWQQVPWVALGALDAFQYRPLTFNLWLAFAHLFGYVPMAMHATWVLIGLCNACLLRSCALRLGALPVHAGSAAIVFLLSPYVVYTHAWIGTLADLLFLMFALLGVVWLCRARKADSASFSEYAKDAAPIAVLTTLALLSKEAAVTFPLLLLCAWPIRHRRVFVPVATSACVVAVYLILRVGVILFAPRLPGGYTWNLANIPTRLTEYSLFPFYRHGFEIAGFDIHRLSAIALPLLAASMVIAAVASTGLRRCFFLALGWAAFLGPILILDSHSNIYAYVATAFACAYLAVTARQMKSWAKCLLALPIVLVISHGLYVGHRMLHIGSMQQHLYADLQPLLVTATADAPLRIRAMQSSDDFVVRRLLHAIPSYHRVPLAERVKVIQHDAKPQEPPTQLMKPSGRLIPAAALSAQGGE